MQEAYVNINSIPTHIFTWGRWIEETISEKEIVICITGNPGLPGFYTEFAGTLQKELGDLPVWVIGHAGHDDPPEASIREVPQLSGNEELFNLDGQIRHKIAFIEKYVPSDVKIHLIGHSIGAWMILQLLENERIRSRIQKCYLLFPTVERMMESPNGWVFTKVAMPLYSVFGYIFFSFFNFLPVWLRLILIQIYFLIFSIPRQFLGTALKYSKPSVAEKVVFLADDEMARVRGIQREIVEHNLDLLKFYYGTTDGWVPISYYDQLKKDYPKVDAQLDTKKIAHAFVLRHSQPMAVIVRDMIQQHRRG
ncbi:lipid droplet-associated hydrolase [Drosophila sechellia]|uniref:Lipid droplet-associated hydrolase n=1 Tax=Drosophila sechellia TaxID=7238 RepID=B4HVR5_DROSE|nr:lipid droplet-associated hydrolase [Drosophila sechellia]EDW50030.1 GM14223 [Drosophila sechellia]